MDASRLIINSFFVCVIAISPKSFAEPHNISLLKAQVHAYYESGEYLHELNQVAASATEYVVHRAEDNAHLASPLKLALVLDIDETSLSNYDNIKKNDFAGTQAAVEASYLNTKSKPIQPILYLYTEAKKHNVAVFFVTGRPIVYKQQTTQSLHNAGYNKWDKIYFKPENYNQKSIVPYKSHIREELVKQGYTVVASIGDQWSDLQGGYAEKVFKLPNPYYFIP